MHGIRTTLVVALVTLTWAAAYLAECSREIGVHGPNNSNTTVAVDVTSTVKDIKLMLESELGIPIERQKLSLNGTELEDTKTVLECKLWRFSVLKLEVDTLGKLVKLDVNCDGNELGQVEAGIWDSIGKIKSIIFFSLGSYPERLKLGGFASTSLRDNSTLNENLFASNSVAAETLKVYCVKKEPNSLQMPVKCLDGQTHLIDIDPHDTVESIKLKIEFKLDVAAERQKLLIDGADEGMQSLENDKSLAYYKIWKYAGLKLITKPKVKLLVHCVPSVNITLQVDPDEPIENIRSILAKELGIPNEIQGLKFNGQIMGDGTRLSDYQNAREIVLLPIEGDTAYLNIVVNNERLFMVSSSYGNRIEVIKSCIETNRRIPATRQRLYLNDLELLNDKTVGDYKLYANTTLKLVVADNPAKSNFRVRNLLGREVSFNVQTNITVRDLKKLIAESPLKIPIIKQRLFFLGHEMDNDNPLRYYDISTDSFIQVATYSGSHSIDRK